LTLETLSLGLLEILPPSPRRQGGRLTITMRHNKGDELSGAGVYLGRQEHALVGEVGHSFVSVAYSETTIEPTVYLGLAAQCILQRPNAELMPHDAGLAMRLPLGLAQPNRRLGLWRTFRIDFSAEGITASVPNQPAINASQKAINDSFDRLRRPLEGVRFRLYAPRNSPVSPFVSHPAEASACICARPAWRFLESSLNRPPRLAETHLL
jgi:hypothetical protein